MIEVMEPPGGGEGPDATWNVHTPHLSLFCHFADVFSASSICKRKKQTKKKLVTVTK